MTQAYDATDWEPAFHPATSRTKLKNTHERGGRPRIGPRSPAAERWQSNPKRGKPEAGKAEDDAKVREVVGPTLSRSIKSGYEGSLGHSQQGLS